MNRILILFAHPRFEQSRVNQALVGSIPERPEITFHDLYELYPNFNVDIGSEQALLLEHNIIIWHHPFYWYTMPPLMKQWIDMVLEFGWAYGPGGTALAGKFVFNTITSGGPRHVYQHEGRNRFTVREFLAPQEQTARLCQMRYLPPFAVQGTHKLTPVELEEHAAQYKTLLNALADGDFDVEATEGHEFLNDWMITLNTTRT